MPGAEPLRAALKQCVVQDRRVGRGSLWRVDSPIDVWKLPSRNRGSQYFTAPWTGYNEVVHLSRSGEVLLVGDTLEVEEVESAGYLPTRWVHVLLPVTGYVNRAHFNVDSSVLSRVSS